MFASMIMIKCYSKEYLNICSRRLKQTTFRTNQFVRMGVNSLHARLFIIFLYSSQMTVFSKLKNKRKKGAILVPNNLDPDQTRPTVGPDMGPNCLQMLSAHAKIVATKEKVK